MRMPLVNELVLQDLINCQTEEIKKHSKTVYEWHNIYFEVLSEVQFKNQKTAGSHYAVRMFEGKKFYVREMGDKAIKVIKIKRRKK